MSKQPTKAQREQWERIRALGCIVCGGMASIHHCFTGAGGRKDHDKVLPLCWNCHQNPKTGIHGGLGRRKWQEIHGSETELMDKVNNLLGE